jgi:hypothetical protein
MATNAKKVEEDDQAKLEAINAKTEEVEVSQETDESKEQAEEVKEEAGEEDGQTDDQTTEAEEQSEATFTKKFPNIKGDTPEEYFPELETAYENSTSEAIKLKQQWEDAQPVLKKAQELLATQGESNTETQVEDLDPVQLYVKQQQDKEINAAFAEISRDYPQVLDQTEYQKFVTKANTLGRVIYETEKRVPSPQELYGMVVTTLGWNKEDNKEKLGAAIKDSAASTKTSSSTKKVTKSKVTDGQVVTARKMFPGKSDSEIRQELEEYVQ